MTGRSTTSAATTCTNPAEFAKYPPIVASLLPRYGGVVLASDMAAYAVEGTAGDGVLPRTADCLREVEVLLVSRKTVQQHERRVESSAFGVVAWSRWSYLALGHHARLANAE